jgi:hypothetical protein
MACRSHRAADHIDEAVLCYRAGAYRQCIVATWIAVVYDYIDKLRDLDRTGDANAKKHLADFQRAHETHNVAQALTLERGLLKVAHEQFELLTALDRTDLERLMEDRHRCAHPSLDSDEEPFVATAELARLHLRNAVDHMLSRPPVQGKAGFERVARDLDSPYFPEDIEEARARLEEGPLGAARLSLVRQVVRKLVEELLTEDREAAERGRRFAALHALLDMDPDVVEHLLTEELQRTTEHLDHAHWLRVLRFIERVPLAWVLLPETDQDVTRRFVEAYDPEPYSDQGLWVFDLALETDGLEAAAAVALRRVRVYQLGLLVERDPKPAYVEETVRRIEASDSFSTTADLRTPLRHAAAGMTEAQALRVLSAYETNRQFRGSYTSPDHVRSVLQHTEALAEATRPAWERIAPLLHPESSIRPLLRERYPDTPAFASPSEAEQPADVESA